MYKVVLFDLDGTLTDPGDGITKSVEYALNKYGIETPDRKELYKFIGPPLHDSFMKYYGFSAEKAEEAIVFYRERFRDTGIFENEVYEGVREMLSQLKASGRKIALATSKPEEFAKRIMEHFSLSEYFDFIGGATFDSTRSKKSDVIAYALKNMGSPDKAGVIMVGDRKHDIIGAKENALKSLGVLYGYGDEAELSQAGADYIAKTPEEVAHIIITE